MKTKYKDMIKKITIIWECDFKAELEKPENQVFKKSIQPNLIFFTRLKAGRLKTPVFELLTAINGQNLKIQKKIYIFWILTVHTVKLV